MRTGRPREYPNSSLHESWRKASKKYRDPKPPILELVEEEVQILDKYKKLKIYPPDGEDDNILCSNIWITPSLHTRIKLIKEVMYESSHETLRFNDVIAHAFDLLGW